MKKIFPPATLILCFLAGCPIACKQKIKQFVSGEGGMTYMIDVDKDGRTIGIGDCVALDYTERTAEGALLFDSRDDNRSALLFREKPHFKGDLFTALGLLSEGDSATFRISLDSMTTKMGLHRPYTKASYLVYTIKVNKVFPRDKPPGRISDSLMNKKIEAFKTTEEQKAHDDEPDRIDEYVLAKQLHPMKTASGLQYIVLRQGIGSGPAAGDSVKVNYTASFLNGKVFETTNETIARQAGIYKLGGTYQPLALPVKAEGALSGFEECLGLFPKGTKVELIIPSRLAYGANGHGRIHPYTPLLCEVEILDIEKH